jgi:hypothetical protein
MSLPSDMAQQGVMPPQQANSIPLVSSTPAPQGPMPADIPQSQMGLQPEPAPQVPGQPGQQPATLFAGRFQSPQELERAYFEQQQMIARQSQEVGIAREQMFTTMQQMIQMQQAQQQPAQPQAPQVDPEQERVRREFELLSPIAQQMIQAAGENADEDAIWQNLLATYQAGNVAAQMQMQPVMQQLQSMQQLVNSNLGQQVLQQRVNEVFSGGRYQHTKPNDVLAAIGQQLDMNTFLGYAPQDQAQIIQMAANNIELQRMWGQGQPQQPGFPAMPQTGMYQPAAPPMMPQQPPMMMPAPMPQQPMMMPAQGFTQPNYGQVPNTMAPTLPQTNAQVDPQFQQDMQYYQMMGIPQDRAMRAAQNAQARRQNGQRW